MFAGDRMYNGKMKSIISHSLEETKKIAEKWLVEISVSADSSNLNVSLESGNSNGKFSKGAAVVGLCGPLGSGKTAFVQAVAEVLGVKEQVTSPTYVLMKLYGVDSKSKIGHLPWNRLVHIDAYRLEKAEEVGALNFESIVSDSRNLILIEWADNIKDALPPDWKKIDFETVSETERRMSFS